VSGGEASAPLEVFYDGGCPLCRREIGYYRRKAPTRSVRWTDVSVLSADDLPSGLTRERALARFHVRSAADGRLRSGGAAFIALWRRVPGFRRLGRLLDNRAGRALMEAAYRAFLLVRPQAQRLVRRLES
jgi:predicted DCC family thiol-disulfide oxidoreductase YuxK